MIKVLDSSLVMRMSFFSSRIRRCKATRVSKRKEKKSFMSQWAKRLNFIRTFLFLVGAEVSESCVIKHSIWRVFGNVLGHCDADDFCLLFISFRVARCLGWVSLIKLRETRKLNQSIFSNDNCETLIGCLSHKWVTSLPTNRQLHWSRMRVDRLKRVSQLQSGTCVTNQSLSTSPFILNWPFMCFHREPSGHRELIWHAATADGTWNESFYSLYGLFTLILISICVT